MPRPVAVFYHPDCLLHDTGPHHPESPARIRHAKQHLEKVSFSRFLHWHKPDPVKTRWLEEIHSPEYRQFIEESCLKGGHSVDFGETVVSHDSYRAALLAAGAAVQSVDAVLQQGYQCAFSLTRPPGHHASTEKAMGFCLFNNIAIAAHYAAQEHGIERICIIDWDVHHGNGTQDIFYASPSILFCSMHQLPLYPHTGEHHETGSGSGRDYTINCPIPRGADLEQYEVAFMEDIAPRVDAFQPHLIFISAGFDAHRKDPLADLRLKSHDYYHLTKWALDVAQKHCRGRVISLLEGGYHLEALAESVTEHLRALVDG